MTLLFINKLSSNSYDISTAMDLFLQRYCDYCVHQFHFNSISTLMIVFRWTLFRALFQPEFRHFRSFLSMDDLAWSIIFYLSDFEAS